MSTHPGQLRELISKILKVANLHSIQAVELLMATAAHESHLGTYLKQLNGPAIGLFKIEPSTDSDNWENFISFRPDLKRRIVDTANVHGPSSWALEINIAYQVLMARVKYLREKSPLPEHTDINGIAKYWNDYYNCNDKKGHPDEFINNYHRFVKGRYIN